MIVMKFGGTSVESGEAIERLTGIVNSHLEQQPIVVVSAMGKTTNKLLEFAERARRGDHFLGSRCLDELHDYHSEVAGQVTNGEALHRLEISLQRSFRDLRVIGSEVADEGREVTPALLDEIASFGERMSSEIVAAALEAGGVPSVHLDARQVILTDSRHTQATPLYWESYAKLRRVIPYLCDGRVVVMGGFIGSTEDGVTTTLGRGGSDFTASIVGAGIGAEEIQIWTDVDGMLTADPTIVPDAHRVKVISFTEAAEMAYFGAKVLHPATVVPAIDRNIPVLILNSRRPQVDGTRIVSEAVASTNIVKSIACKSKVVVMSIRSTRMFMAHGFMRRIFEIFDRYETSVDMVATSEVSVSLTIDQPERVQAIAGALREFADVSVDENQAIICMVGENIRHSPGVAARVFKALGSINVRMVSQGASALNLGFVVAGKDLAAAVPALHREFFSELDPAVFDA
jgi:aspartate kinase